MITNRSATADTHDPLGLTRRVTFDAAVLSDPNHLLSREWLVTNGLGGYAAGTLAGVLTRRYHGVLIAALPAPLGRLVMVSQVAERLRLPGNRVFWLSGEERKDGALYIEGANRLREFRLEAGLPVWTYAIEGYVLEKRLLLPRFQNTVLVTYTLLAGDDTVRLGVRPLLNARPHEAAVDHPLPEHPTMIARDRQLEVQFAADTPPLRLRLAGTQGAFTFEPQTVQHLYYRKEESRGYQAIGDAWTPGYFRMDLRAGDSATMVASTEGLEMMNALRPEEARAAEHERRRRLLWRASPAVTDQETAELVLAADQFVITPAGRLEDAARARAAGDEARTVIAGYHWFTDWGRDTMISLEGLTLTTGRVDEARDILRTFAFYFRDGLIPNLFPEGNKEGLYNTADATLWFFQALHRYAQHSDDWATVRHILPKLDESVAYHLSGTRFNIGVDPADGLLRQGADQFALTWMDAKMGDWVVTPRRGKAVEINALWYNALRLLGDWHEQLANPARADELRRLAARTYESFNRRFWFENGQHLYDVVDGEQGDDGACRPNQIFSFALEHPVLDPSRWQAVLTAVETRLLTPVGLRSLDPQHPDYRSTYSGDLRSRDGAYHQGTVWGWLIGPFVDAWIRAHPERAPGARRYLTGILSHLDEACVGSISEIFDAEEPYTARGCVAQAWSVAEVLRCWVKTATAHEVARGATTHAREGDDSTAKLREAATSRALRRKSAI
ncbi:MAG TPA: amylo-alpha-1,6-glucosidase [Vicinamibacterales bacterium]|nr:amylo-alpha-1,6-glucosidase [Vicinamibacterales bacterium]